MGVILFDHRVGSASPYRKISNPSAPPLNLRNAPGLLADLAAVIEAEHRCCPFLRFALTVAPGDGPVTLEMTGREGTKEFLESLLAP